MSKRIISTILSFTLLITCSCAGSYRVHPSTFSWGPIKAAKLVTKKSVAKEFVRPSAGDVITLQDLSPSMQAFGEHDFEPLAPDEKRSAVVVAIVLILLIAASIAVPIITLTTL